ncbi:MAG: hypothetical protein K8Q99_07500 [Acholeplasmataceae bacterium]|nr:hypothetical protein [Acholeplasmataceae bacterium]
MKKVFSLVLFFVALVGLTACGNNGLGDFPEVNENKKVDMTAEEMNTLLSTVDMDTQMEQAMLLSIDLDMSVEEEYINYWTMIKEYDMTMDLELSSKTYISLSDQIDEVTFISNNSIDLAVEYDYVSTAMDDESESIKGDLDIYFTEQYLYYNVDVNSSSEEDMIENGKYKMNLGITQTMWDELFVSPEDMVDDYLDIGINPDELLDSLEMMTFLIDAGMISAYKDGSTYTFMINLTKANILSNINALLDATMDTTGWDTYDYMENAIEIQDAINEFDKLELSVVYVIEDDEVQKFGIEMDIELVQEGMTIKIAGQIVADMNVELPKLPKDLDEYDLTDSPLGGLGF